MAARSIASLSLAFGLVSIPVKLYSATEQSSAIRFKLMGRGGTRLRQQYVSDVPLRDAGLGAADDSADVDQEHSLAEQANEPSRPAPVIEQAQRQLLKLVDTADFRPSAPLPAPACAEPTLVERADMVKGYEFEKGKFVLFTPEELKALQSGARQTIDIVSFIPERSVDPIYYDKAYFLAPDKRGAKTYSLLLAAMRESGRCALAKWAWRSKEYVVQIRPAEGGLVLQQLLYADEVRSLADLGVELVAVGEAELKLALQLIAHISEDSYDPHAFVDEEKRRILAAVEQKLAGREVVVPEQHAPTGSAQVVDLIAALQASLRPVAPHANVRQPGQSARETARKPAQRAMKSVKTQKDAQAAQSPSGSKSRTRK